MADYPVLDGAGATVVAASRDPAYVPAPYDNSADYPVLDGNGAVVVAEAYEGAWSPAALFAASEPGVWLDPSDITTLFQDSAGTTPVTAAGQPVGLMLDKSNGLVLGPELAIDGGFDVSVANWSTASSATVALVGGKLRVTNGATAFGFAYYAVPTTVGKNYQFSIDVTYIADNWVVRIGDNTSGTTNQKLSAANSISQTVEAIFVATATTTYVRVGPALSTLGAYVDYDDFTVRELPGYHASQATAGSRPTYQIDAGGRPYLAFDGVDDFLVTPTITPGTDKVQVFAGLRKLSDATFNVIAETSADHDLNNGSMTIYGRNGPGYTFASRGTTSRTATITSGFASPISNVLTGLGDVSGDLSTLRVDGVQVAQSTADQGTGNYLPYPLYIGRRGGTSLPALMDLYQLSIRFGANLYAPTIARAEAFFAGKTGVTL